jgi:hypothetical protein
MFFPLISETKLDTYTKLQAKGLYKCVCIKNRGSSVSAAITLRAGRLSSIPGRGRDVLLVTVFTPTQGPTTPLIQQHGTSPRDVKLIIHLHLVPRLRMHGANFHSPTLLIKTGTTIFQLFVSRVMGLTNYVALVRERTIPTERPPLVGEVSANVCGQMGVAWLVRWIPYGGNLGFLDRRVMGLQTHNLLNNLSSCSGKYRMQFDGIKRDTKSVRTTIR